ncbi:alpha/beta fold hydrolase [Streptomyces sp. e14]|uniref:alpha/beta fold hydrolase n=1 Tax=Streptomyces sp. e14 TaxID=645465 RepID=UPI003FCD6C9D
MTELDCAPPEELRVPVPGGELAVLRWPAAAPGAPVVLALHGITANGLSWARVAHHLAGRATLVAPDLRGRGGSGELPGPYGIAAHADDMAAVVKELGLGRVVLTGHSMGAFTAALTAVRHPGLLSGLLLVDGGVGLPRPHRDGPRRTDHRGHRPGHATPVDDLPGPGRLPRVLAEPPGLRRGVVAVGGRVHPARSGRRGTGVALLLPDRGRTGRRHRPAR